MKKKSQRLGAKEEEFLLEIVKKSLPNVAMTSNSGAVFQNGDLGKATCLIEIKSTKAASYRLENKLVKTVKHKALWMGKDPVLIVLTESENPKEENAFVIFPLEMGLHLVKEMEDGKDKEKRS